jgi:DNA-binding TFAR19-related protein (PDSD5 family)
MTAAAVISNNDSVSRVSQHESCKKCESAVAYVLELDALTETIFEAMFVVLLARVSKSQRSSDVCLRRSSSSP